MSFKANLLDWGLALIEHVHPEYSRLIDWLRKNVEVSEKLFAVVEAAIRQGGSAMDAVKRDAPDLANAITDFVDAAAPVSRTAHASHSVNAENVARSCFGFPRMTDAEERAWMARPASVDDSRAGGG